MTNKEKILLRTGLISLAYCWIGVNIDEIAGFADQHLNFLPKLIFIVIDMLFLPAQLPYFAGAFTTSRSLGYLFELLFWLLLWLLLYLINASTRRSQEG